MGCKASKPAAEEEAPPLKNDADQNNNLGSTKSHDSGKEMDVRVNDNLPLTGEKSDKLYKLLAKSQMTHNSGNDEQRQKDLALQRENWTKVMECCKLDPRSALYQNPTTKSTPLHMAVRLIDSESGSASSDSISLTDLIRALIKANPKALAVKDAGGNIPLHYAIAPTTHFQPGWPMAQWKLRSDIVRLLVHADPNTAQEYMTRNDVLFESGDSTGGCTPLYRVLQTLPDDFEAKGPTYQYMVLITEASPNMSGVGNQSEGDKPLALLYRRFTRQFDISEKFFSGDNSRTEVVEHRRKYKAAAGNTWKIIELLLRPTTEEISAAAASSPTGGPSWRIVHRAVQVETPPDLLRYIVETNPEDLTQTDHKGNSPLHYAAASKPPDLTNAASFPAFYTKYVVDELLYKFPEGAQIRDGEGRFPLTLAINSGKQWIGGGIKSLYDAYPAALEQSNLPDHPNLKRILSLADEAEKKDDDDDDYNGTTPRLKDSVIKDEQHDAIMLVQQDGVDVTEVSTSMWAHEEDAGVQMLGCVAIAKLAKNTSEDVVLRISLSAVAAVVNAMKAHPNEVIVQEKACHALRLLAQADGKREVSFVASGAVAAIVGAMQAHVGDAGVQEEACGAIAAIVHYGGTERATIVASVSGLTAIVNAIAAHPGAKGVQKQGCRALLELTEFSDANLPELHRSQTAPLLEAAKKSFPEECTEFANIVLSRMS
ncbi:expressed unknown protein [Seminavis robusta]|uniref:LRRK2 ARM repeat domain-containing protein n=2 Tax=Seminavis robusta TaxID=568900 RepID=A0A9N8HHA4_9STRA|nr:expressed unknown protein [Seminavis robusta]|eukprot:Sro693_g188370.1 n/a (711) ;mRNA; r:42832-44964